MVCTVCRNMLQRQEGRVWKGTYDLVYNHHTSYESLQESVKQNCGICRALHEEFEIKVKVADAEVESEPQINETDGSNHSKGIVTVLGSAVWIVGRWALGLVRAVLSMLCFSALASSTQVSEIAKIPLTVEASLSVHKIEQLYHLDMTLHYGRRKPQLRVQRTFFLENPKPRNKTEQPRRSNHTSSEEVFVTAVQWLERCQCAKARKGKFYPSRLLSLQRLKTLYDYENHRQEPFVRELADAEVNLVETQRWFDGSVPEDGTVQGPGYGNGNREYVTLSHCWGNKVNDHHRLKRTNYDEFTKAIPVGNLPKTFRDAIYFAAKLKDVGYIWIDSLCIIQGDHKDWLHQSADMDRVYSQTFLNLSATASSNSEGGLFRSRDPGMLIKEDVTLNIRGLPGAYAENGPVRVNSGAIDSTDTSADEEDRRYLRPCTILNASLWIDRVDTAPVNRRAWVLQERLMSPRVLHFCRDQIAWECLGSKGCNGFDAVEEQSHGLSDFQMTSRGIVKRRRLKDLDIDEMTEVSALFQWAQIVEAYSKTNLTQSKDKLIALSGLAKMMSKKFSNPRYVAGLWETHLASQLLWRVEPSFNHSDGTFSHPATPPGDYRAPSFSWAALDAINHGIVYGDIAERGMLITVEKIQVTPFAEKNPYGLIMSDPEKKACITIRGKLRQARLVSIEKGRYAWYLIGREELDDEQHRNVYLDCPSRDRHCIGNPHARVYVVPAAQVRDGAAAGSSHLICLILKFDPAKRFFSRIGITKLTPYLDKKAMVYKKDAIKTDEYPILEKYERDIDMPHEGWFKESGEHRIRLI